MTTPGTTINPTSVAGFFSCQEIESRDSVQYNSTPIISCNKAVHGLNLGETATLRNSCSHWHVVKGLNAYRSKNK
jgi:hypothetical protein